MKIKNGFVLRNMAGEYLAVPFDERYEDVGGLISLNESGAFLFEKLTKPTNEEALKNALKNEYGVDENTAETAVSSFIESLKQAGLLEVEEN